MAHFAVDDDRACLALLRELLSYLPSNNLEEPPRRRSDDPPDREDPALDTLIPEESSKPYDMKRLIRAVVDDGALPRGARALRPEHRGGLRALRRPQRGHRGQPAGGAGRLPRHRRLREGRPLRALLRRLQHPAGHLRGRARLPARHRPGVGRHHPPRRQAALRLRRGHRAQDHGHHAQGLRRRLLRDGHQAHPHRPQLRLPDGRDRGDGPGGGGQRALPARALPGGRPGGPARAEGGRVPRQVRQPLRGGRPRLHRRGHRAAGTRGARSSPGWR